MAALNYLGSQVTVLKAITTYTDPVLQLSYQPSSPTLTIRTIISAISSAKNPPFKVSVYRPPALEEHARNAHTREQRRLLYRFIFSVAVTIPTFIIAVVYMTLVKDGNPTKTFLMEPMWTANTSRAVWALFFLATPVMFYSASLFHQRSIMEIRVLWRRGSTTPILKRFIRFGSMNLLVRSSLPIPYSIYRHP
jgi:cation transport ATPase